MGNIDELLGALLSAADSSDKKSQNNTDSEEKNGSDGKNDGAGENSADFFDGIDIDMIMKIGEIMSKLGETDKNTELLLALKPHLREENKAKIDTAVKLFRLISLLPYLKDSGMFDNLF